MKTIVIDNVAILCDAAPESLNEGIGYYSNYLRHGGTLEIQPYLCLLSKLAKSEEFPDPLQSWLKHYGKEVLFRTLGEGMLIYRIIGGSNEPVKQP